MGVFVRRLLVQVVASSILGCGNAGSADETDTDVPTSATGPNEADGTNSVGTAADDGSGTGGGTGVLPATCVSLPDGRFDITETVRFDAMFESVLQVHAATETRVEAIQAALEQLAGAWDLPIPASPASAEDVGDLMAGIAGALPPGVQMTLASDWVRISCGIDGETGLDVAEACLAEAECDGPGASVGCDGTCEGSCSGECSQVLCRPAPAQCERVCEGVCVLTVAATCDGICEGSCDEAGEVTENYSAYCPGSCTGQCLLNAGGACPGQCDGACGPFDLPRDSCQESYECRDDCDGTCDGACIGTLVLETCDEGSVCETTASLAAAPGAACASIDVRIAYQGQGDDPELDARIEALAVASEQLLPLDAELEMLVGSDDFDAPSNPVLLAAATRLELLVAAGTASAVFDIIAPERVHCVVPALLEARTVMQGSVALAYSAAEATSVFRTTFRALGG